MGIAKLVRDYEALTRPDQAVFAAVIRAHQLFNSPPWRTEISRRHESVEIGNQVNISSVEQLLNPTACSQKDDLTAES